MSSERYKDGQTVTNGCLGNLLNTKEIVFHRPDPHLYIPHLYIPSVPLSDIEQVKSIQLPGGYLMDTLRFDEHVKYILTICSQRLYLLKNLRVHINKHSFRHYCYQGLPFQSGRFLNAASN